MEDLWIKMEDEDQWHQRELARLRTFRNPETLWVHISILGIREVLGHPAQPGPRGPPGLNIMEQRVLTGQLGRALISHGNLKEVDSLLSAGCTPAAWCYPTAKNN